MLVKSKLTGKLYEEEAGIKIPNHLQAYKYMINGLQMIDVIYTDRLIPVFDRAESKPYFDLWCKHEL